MDPVTSRWEHLTWPYARRTAALSIGVSFCSLVMACGLGFQGGWANGWPLGISQQTVFAWFVTIVFAIVSIGLATGVLIVLGYLAERITRRPFVGWISFVASLILVSAAILLACLHVYAATHLAMGHPG